MQITMHQAKGLLGLFTFKNQGIDPLQMERHMQTESKGIEKLIHENGKKKTLG